MVAAGVAATMLIRFVPFVAFAFVPSIPWRGVMLHR